MTKENRKLRDALRTIEARATTALEHQPDDDALCLIHLGRALIDISDTVADAVRAVLELRPDIFTAPSGGAPEARKSRRQEGKPTPANS